MQDVAREAGVSPSTVSRVLNESSLVRGETRERVLEAVRVLGYRPNEIASHFRRRGSRMIGVVVPDIADPYFAEIVRAAEDAAYADGRRLLICSTDQTPEKQAAYLRVLAAERVAGVILSPSDPAAPEIGELLDLNIPIVAIDRSVTDTRADAVLTNNLEAGRRAVRHLIALGHRDIGFVGGPLGIETADERLAGYQEAMREFDLEPSWASGPFSAVGGWQSTMKLFDEKRPLTALITASSLITIGTLQVLRRHSLRVPTDVALVVIGEPPWAELAASPLTTLATARRQIAERAVAFLVERLNRERAEPRRLVLDFHLRVRESCGARLPAHARQPRS